MNESIESLKKKLSVLDVSQSQIEKASEEFLKIAIMDESSMEDLVKLWKFYLVNKTDKLAFIFLANDIIQNSFFKKLKLHEIFFDHLIEVFPNLFSSLNDKLRKEIFRVIEIWEDRKIYDIQKLENLKGLLNVTTIPNVNTLENPFFSNYLKNNKIKISEKIKEMASNLEEFKRLEEIIQKYEEQGNQEDALKRSHFLLNSTRGKLLVDSADIIKKQNQVYFKHVHYLQEVEKLLERLNNNIKTK